MHLPLESIEEISQSTFSPGVVLNSEILLKTYNDPAEIDNGRFINDAFQSSHLLDSGVSVHRETYCDEEIMRVNAEKRAKNVENRAIINGNENHLKQVIRVASIRCGTVREIFCNILDSRIFSVHDTALEEETLNKKKNSL